MQKHNHCCLCKVTHPALLRASHIHPWAVSSSKEKLDINNGLLLCPNHDTLFDTGLISFDCNGKILISEKLSHTDKIFMNVHSDMAIELTTEMEVYMDYHRNKIFE